MSNIANLVGETVARRACGEQTPWDIVCEMEEPLRDICDFADALQLMTEGLQADASGAVSRIARSIGEIAESVEKQRAKLFDVLHPNQDVLADDGDGEVEESASDVTGADHV